MRSVRTETGGRQRDRCAKTEAFSGEPMSEIAPRGKYFGMPLSRLPEAALAGLHNSGSRSEWELRRAIRRELRRRFPNNRILGEHGMKPRNRVKKRRYRTHVRQARTEPRTAGIPNVIHYTPGIVPFGAASGKPIASQSTTSLLVLRSIALGRGFSDFAADCLAEVASRDAAIG